MESIHPTLSDAEKAYATTGVVIGNHPFVSSLRERVIHSNYRRAEAFHLEHETLAIEQIRTLISRNRLDFAEKWIQTSLAQNPPTEEKIYLLLEMARVKNAQARWADAVAFAIQAIQAGAKSQGLLTLFQILSIAQFEQGQLSAARQSLSQALSLAEIYPKGLAVLYAKTLEIKIRARLYGVESIIIPFRRLWEETLEAHPGSLDAILTMVRVQADLKRLQEKDFTAEALAAYFISREMGDDLYELLALSELLHSPIDAVATSARMLLPEARIKEHSRISDLLNPKSSSETAKNLRSFIQKTNDTVSVRSHVLSHADALYITGVEVMVQLKTREFTKMDLQPKVRQMLQAISIYRVTEADLFSKIWKLKYARARHHENLRTTFKRVKQQAGISVKNTGGDAELPGLIVIGELDA